MSGRDDRLGDRRGSKAEREVRGDRDDGGVSGTEGQAAAAGSAMQESGWVPFIMQVLHHALAVALMPATSKDGDLCLCHGICCLQFQAVLCGVATSE